jgi:hypothetical protein
VIDADQGSLAAELRVAEPTNKEMTLKMANACYHTHCAHETIPVHYYWLHLSACSCIIIIIIGSMVIGIIIGMAKPFLRSQVAFGVCK